MTKGGGPSAVGVQLSDSTALPGRCQLSTVPSTSEMGGGEGGGGGDLKTGGSGVNAEKVSVRTQLEGKGKYIK